MRRSALLVLVLIAAACAGPEPDVETTAPPPGVVVPAASMERSDSAPGTVRFEGGGFAYLVEMGDDGCIGVTITGGGRQPETQGTCPEGDFGYGTFSGCLGGTVAGCEVRLPGLLYGRARGQIASVCLPSDGAVEGEFGPVSFLVPDETGLFATVFDGGTVPFPYTRAGIPWGDPPLDAPARVIERQCEAAGPWQAQADQIRAVEAHLRIEFPDGAPSGILSVLVVDEGGFVVDAASTAGEEFWSFLYPSGEVRIGIGATEGQAMGGENAATVVVPPIPAGLGGPLVLVVEVGGNPEAGLDPEEITLRWEDAP
jgi:hypothetical protein